MEFTRTLVLVLDLIGTFVFALSGAAVGIRHNLDLFGVLVLSVVAATAGGITRDVMLGATPPAAIADWRYIVVASTAGLLMFLSYPFRQGRKIDERLRKPILIFDALGLSLFAVAGAIKALAFQLGPLQAVLIGALTAIGGGVLRDMLVSEVPIVLQRSELYAVAAMSGATVVVVGRMFALPSQSTALAGAALCFVLRVISIRKGWRLPTATWRASDHPDRPS